MHGQAFKSIKEGRAKMGLPCPFFPTNQQARPLDLLEGHGTKKRNACPAQFKSVCTIQHAFLADYTHSRMFTCISDDHMYRFWCCDTCEAKSVCPEQHLVEDR